MHVPMAVQSVPLTFSVHGFQQYQLHPVHFHSSFWLGAVKLWGVDWRCVEMLVVREVWCLQQF
jgi:hypothetical protein